MRPLPLTSVRTILCLGAHSDDIEIGCGGTLLSLAANRPDLKVHAVIFSADGCRADEARTSFDALLPTIAQKRLDLHTFPDTCFPFVGMEIKEVFRKLQKGVSPDLIFTHRGQDAHQDHRLISELTWNAFRDHLILEYEIPKYEGDLATPNVYFPLDEVAARRKLDHLARHFSSQQSKPWYSSATFESLLRLRAIECNAPNGLAEGFYARKICFTGVTHPSEEDLMPEP